jgi:hypothetical protein
MAIGVSFFSSTVYDTTSIYATYTHTGSCLELLLVLVFVCSTSALTNGMWCQVHREAVVLLFHHTLCCYVVLLILYMMMIIWFVAPCNLVEVLPSSPG